MLYKEETFPVVKVDGRMFMWSLVFELLPSRLYMYMGIVSQWPNILRNNNIVYI